METTTQGASPTELHPIANQALLLLEQGEDGRHTLDLGAERILQRALEKSFASPDLRHAVLSLISLAKYLDDQDSRQAADALLRVAGTAIVALRSRGAIEAKLAEDLNEMTTRKFAAFTATDLARVAPMQNAKAAVGTLSIASLASMKPRRA